MNTFQAITNIPTKNKLRGAAGEIETFAMANCLMLFSSQKHSAAAVVSAVSGGGYEEVGRSFPCKTCGRKFPSFQALGGHRASHKKIKPSIEVSGEALNVPAKPRVHACSICGVEFLIGQALGGHMRRHRGLLGGSNGGDGDSGGSTVVSCVMTEGSSGNSDGNDSEKKRKLNDDVFVPILKKSNCNKRVCLDLDLNLTLSIWKEVQEEDTVVDGGGDGDGDDDGIDRHGDEYEVEEGEILQSVNNNNNNKVEEKDVDDFLRLELRLPS